MGQQVLKKRYAIQKQLGQNGGRRTVLAQDLQTQELVAIKLLTFSTDFHWDDLKLFEREAQILQSLSNPAIPRYLDSFKFQTSKTKGFALVQNYIEAKSLEEWVKSGRSFNESEIKEIAQSLLEILIYLHAQSPPVIHRDIKPSNILLENRSGNSVGQIYLVDFGSVQTLAATEGSTITVVGTYGYMPPEQFGGRAVPASDLYGLGATLIYLVTQTHPADLPQEDLRLQFQPKIPLDSYLVNWLNCLIEPDLNKRFVSASQALQFLSNLPQASKISSGFGDNLGYVSKSKCSKFNGTEVKINKNNKQLEIIFYPSCLIAKYILGLSTLILVLIKYNWRIFQSLRMVGNLFTFGYIMKTSFLETLFWGCFGVSMLSLFFLAFLIIMKVFFPKINRLKIDEDVISMNTLPSSPTNSIDKIEFDSLSHQSRRNILIWTKTELYKLPTQTLTSREIDWIAFELSRFLNLPITK